MPSCPLLLVVLLEGRRLLNVWYIACQFIASVPVDLQRVALALAWAARVVGNEGSVALFVVKVRLHIDMGQVVGGNGIVWEASFGYSPNTCLLVLSRACIVAPLAHLQRIELWWHVQNILGV